MIAELGSTGHADRLRVLPLEAAGKTVVDGTVQMLTDHPNMAFFGLKDNSGVTWKVTPLLDIRSQQIKTVTVAQHGDSGRIIAGWQVAVLETPQGTRYAVSSIAQENKRRNKRRSISKGFEQLVRELFPPAEEAKKPDQPIPDELKQYFR
jgi:hypothetical protein